MPYAAGDPNCFESFMKEFNATAPTLNNVLWLDDNWLVSGYRFSRSLGANEIAVDGGAIFPEGNVSRKGAEAAVNFIRRLSSWLIVEKTGRGPIPKSTGPLHQLRGGKIEKKPARGVPSRGGGGDRQPARGRGGNNQFGNRQGQRKRGQL
ncbi:hypothetical protein AAVH_37428 [Aphelenchoides avenae]|nr:hypothetical protein AAVH_37428 [Aphelenchus avenae]